MIRKKKDLTRKQRALRRSLLAVTLIVIYIISSEYQFTRDGAMQKAARRYAMNPVELFMEQRDSSGTHLALSRNEDAILFHRFDFSPLWGWTSNNAYVPFSHGYYEDVLLNSFTVHAGKANTHVATYFYGVLPKEATQLELVARPADDPPQAGPGGTIEFSQENFHWDEKSGRWFFLVESPYDANAFVTGANVWSWSNLLAEGISPSTSASSSIN